MRDASYRYTSPGNHTNTTDSSPEKYIKGESYINPNNTCTYIVSARGPNVLRTILQRKILLLLLSIVLYRFIMGVFTSSSITANYLISSHFRQFVTELNHSTHSENKFKFSYTQMLK